MARRNLWFTNRVYIGLIIFLVIIGFWEFSWKPQYRPFYEQGVRYYQAGRYMEALAQFDRAYSIAPNSMDVVMMEGWTTLKLNRFEDSRMYFERVLRFSPDAEEAQIGAAFVAMETGRGKLDYKILMKYLGKRLNDPNVAILVAGALLQDGRTFEAAEMLRNLQNDPSYGEVALITYKRIFGLEDSTDVAPSSLPKKEKANQLQATYRATKDGLFALEGSDWKKFYVNGVNLGPGAPGFYPAAPPHSVTQYATWLQNSEDMGANVIRAYTLLPPAFYRAYKKHIAKGGKITLYQQIWVSDPPNKDLYDPAFVEQARAEIRYAVDALHGSADVPPKRARGNGIYDQDIARNVSALLLGRELEASVAIQTNIVNGGKQSYQGKYVSIPAGTATEVWFAEMLDYMVAYETDTYNWQHPVAIVNWPPLDPLFHPTEAPNMEEVKYRMKRGEKLELPKEVDDDNDTVAIDEAKYQISGDLYAGFFASYHVYPYYPDFLLHDPKYLNTRDSEGLNPVQGYLKDLRAHIPYPLVVTEYGMPDSMGISHFHPYGWHHGGHSEDQQGAIMRQLNRSIRDTGCSGGIVFALVDEWYKHNWLTVDFENPIDRAALWLNELDPEKRYGLIGYRPSKWKLFNGTAADWEKETTLYQRPGKKNVSVQAASDEAFVYLRLNGACVECLEPNPKAEKLSYAFALNTFPDRVGLKQMPFRGASVSTGANFLVALTSTNEAKILVADTYNPYHLSPKPGVPNETELTYRRAFTPDMDTRGTFQELLVETNRRRFGRDGTMFPGQRYSRSQMRYTTMAERDKDSLAEWYTDPKSQAVIIRIPWGKLLVTDPSSRRAFFGFDSAGELSTAPTLGLEISLFELKREGNDLAQMSVLSSFPERDQMRKKLEWKTWEKLTLEPYFKKAYFVMQKEYLESNRDEKSTGVANAAPVGSTPAASGQRAK
ncbi:MAG TPA: tetratricopeptide repeat protein [Terriglobales bacterium]|nr:tetratricopeptide repeat protein [Terriglobales bacterium]